MKWLGSVIAGALSLVFGFSGATKLLDPLTFSRDIENYHLLVHPWPGVLAVYLPWLEVFAAAALLPPRLRAGAAWLLAGLLLLFNAALAAAAIRGLEVRCGCFGAASAAIVPIAMLRALALLGLAMGLLWLKQKERAPARGGDERDASGVLR